MVVKMTMRFLSFFTMFHVIAIIICGCWVLDNNNNKVNGFHKKSLLIIKPHFRPILLQRSEIWARRSPSCADDDNDSTDNEKGQFWSSRRSFLASSGTAASIATSILPNIDEKSWALAESDDFSTTKATGEEGINNNSALLSIPFSSRRQYKKIVLKNGLRVLLVSDKKASSCTAALSIDGAGQFSEPIPGLAHLMEHMTLSSDAKFGKRKGNTANDKYTDFEEWLGDCYGASNAFTGPGMVCYHYCTPAPEIFKESLERFASLFEQETILRTLQNENTIKREIRRVDSELDFSADSSKYFYLLKHLMNPAHPFYRFSSGSFDTLEKDPKLAGIDISTELIEFYKKHYLPNRAVLVVVGKADIATLEKWVDPVYSKVLSREQDVEPQGTRPYPTPVLNKKSKPYQMVLLRSSSKQDSSSRFGGTTNSIENLSFQWPLNIIYHGLEQDDVGPQMIAAPAVGFVIAQIIGRRGPGSLYRFLNTRGWVPQGLLMGLPRISFPVDVSGFQILKLDINLTLEGFANRSAVIAAVFDSISSIMKISPQQQSFLLPRDLLRQYITVGTLHGYTLAARPPDAVELTVDAQTYGLGGSNGVGVTGVWPIMPNIDDNRAVDALRRAVSDTLSLMNNPSKGIVIVTASPRNLAYSSSFVDQQLPPIASRLWKQEPVSGAKYYPEDMMGLAGLVEMWIADKFIAEDEIGPPTCNPLIPARITPPTQLLSAELSSLNNIPRAISKRQNSWQSGTKPTESNNSWNMFHLSQNADSTLPRLQMPIMPPESSCRCAFVLQLLSSRPARASVKQGAQAQLWLLSFESAVNDLAEQGAPGALAYDVSFNKFGLRICFLGISQTLPSYARRVCRRLVFHSTNLKNGPPDLPPSTVDVAVNEAKRLRSVSNQRKRQIIGGLCDSTAMDVAKEGCAFLDSCSGGVGLAQGDDFTKNDGAQLLEELRRIFKVTGRPSYEDGQTLPPPAALPNIADIVEEKPMWKPRGASTCYNIPAASLISDPCGRVKR